MCWQEPHVRRIPLPQEELHEETYVTEQPVQPELLR